MEAFSWDVIADEVAYEIERAVLVCLAVIAVQEE